MVRSARIEDISRIAEILVFGKRCAYRSIFNDDAGSFNELQVLGITDEYRAEPSLLNNVLVYDDGIVKGMLNRRYGSIEAELVELYVEPFFTGMGIGHSLMEHFLEEAKNFGLTSAGLWVIRDNAKARKFYASCGFLPNGQEALIEGTAVTELRYTKML